MIRNFCIIAHIDHGKSTLADRMLELTQSVKKLRHGQMLDTMDIEQERGITIKLTPARMQWKGCEFNLIDTPGHADFQYEVSRSLAAVEGAILLVDASQGIQAQTLSTLYMAMEHNLTIIPVLNKIDLPAADPDRVAGEIENLLGIPKEDVIAISAKTGANVDKVLDAIIERIEEPKNIDINGVGRALIFDSVYDKYKGVVVYVKIMSGTFEPSKAMRLIHSKTDILPPELGYLTPVYSIDKKLSAGQIGYIVTGKRSVRDAQIGDTIILTQGLQKKNDHDFLQYAISGFKKAKAYVYAGIYPIDTSDYEKLKESFEKLALNDSAIDFEHETSTALGFGFRCGFLGMLHMDIVKERLEREYNMETLFTTPTVPYLVYTQQKRLQIINEGKNIADLFLTGLRKEVLKIIGVKDVVETEKQIVLDKYGSILQQWIVVRSGSSMIEKGQIEKLYEPIADVEIVGPNEYAGNIMALAQEYRGELLHMEYIDETRVVWKYSIPLGEIIIDFNDRLKSATKGYATMNYEFKKYVDADLVKLDVLINNELIEAFALIVHKDKAYYVGRDLCLRLKDLIPKHMFSIPIQASIGTKVIARETISALKKDVISKCYGGDVSRKRKLLQKQKEGKKKMKAMGSVSVPSDVFIKMVTKENA